MAFICGIHCLVLKGLRVLRMYTHLGLRETCTSCLVYREVRLYNSSLPPEKEKMKKKNIGKYKYTGLESQLYRLQAIDGTVNHIFSQANPLGTGTSHISYRAVSFLIRPIEDEKKEKK